MLTAVLIAVAVVLAFVFDRATRISDIPPAQDVLDAMAQLRGMPTEAELDEWAAEWERRLKL